MADAALMTRWLRHISVSSMRQSQRTQNTTRQVKRHRHENRNGVRQE